MESVPGNDSNLRGLRAALLLLVAMLLISAIRYYPPAPRPADSPPDVFRMERAMPFLEDLVGDGIPHPVGSEQNAVVRGRIIDALESMGYQVEVQEAIVERRGEIYQLFNLVTRLEGTVRGESVMLVSHYDSVRQGPGASDAGVCVATILEIARILKGEPRPRNDIVFLITDGEEAGLLGAQAFVDEHPWAPGIAVAVNLEARGTSGPSLMFETSDQDAWLARLFSRTVKRPFTSSLFAEVYKTMPNDTDFTIFKKYGIEGFNFAFIGSGWNYHTPDDDLNNVNAPSFQHQGDNALALIRALSQYDLNRQQTGKAVYFDLLSFFVIRWGQPWSVPLAVICLLLLIVISVVIHARGRGRLGAAGAAAGLWLVVLIGAVLCGIVFHYFLDLTGTISERWLQHPLILNIAIWLLALLWTNAVVQHGLKPFKIASGWEMWSGLWICLAVIGLLLAIGAPGASYLALAPVIAATIIGSVFILLEKKVLKNGAVPASLLSMAAMACLWIQHEFLFYDAFGFSSIAVVMGRVVLVTSCVMPVLVESGREGRRLISTGIASLFIITTALALIVQ